MEEIEHLQNIPLNSDDGHLNRLENLKSKLEEIRKSKIKGMILRSKLQWIEEGEKPTKFFANLEKKNYVNKLIN